jgi:type I restriction enzyme S subunit
VSHDDLPEGWVSAKLRDIVSPSKKKIEPCERPNAPYLSLEHIESETARIVGRGTGADVESTKAVFHAGDVLYGKLRPYLNKVCIPEFDGICSTDILVFSKPRLADNRFLMRFLMQQEVVAYANHNSTGIQLPRISFDKLGEFSIRLPPLFEQHRIVAKVEALLARVNAARQRLAKVPAILKRFRQSVLAAACSGRLTTDSREAVTEGTDVPSSWRVAKLSAIATRVTDGTHLPPPLAPAGIPFVLIGNVVSKRIDWSGIRKWVTQETYERLTARCRPERGDVLYTAVGATFGQALEVDFDHPFIFQRHIAHIKPKRNEINASYLVQVLNSPKQYAHASEVARGAAQPTVTLADLKEFAIPVPPLAEQHEIVHRVEALFRLADAIEKQVAVATARAEKLTQAILAKAFRGELVPTEAELARREGRDYEPASVVLERIRAERAMQPASKPPRRTKKPRGK